MSSYHPNPKRYPCQICGKVLSSKQNLQQHIAVHTGETPLKCPFPDCPASFKHASQLSTHKAIHRRNLPNRLDFTDLKNFIQLILMYFETEHKPQIKLPSGPYTAKDSKLPEILCEKIEAKLPLMETLSISLN